MTAVIGDGGRIVQTSAAWDAFAAANGADPTRTGVGTDYLAVCSAGDPASHRVAEAIRRGLAGEPVSVSVEYPCHGPGELRWFLAEVTGIGVDPPLVAVVHRRVDGAVRDRALEGPAHLGLIEVGADLDLRFADTAWQRLRGRLEAEDVGRRWLEAVHGDQRESLAIRLADRVAEGGGVQETLEVQIAGPSGYRWAEAVIRPATGGGGTVHGFVIALRDPGGSGEARSRDDGGRDPLTGLPDRTRLEQHLDLALARARRQGVQVGLAFLDLDDFKPVNDTHGHHVGDEVLQVIAERISRAVRPTELVVRLGGDEFVVVVADIDDPEQLDQVCLRLRHELEPVMRVAGGAVELSVRASIGVATSLPEDGAADLLHRADLAMYAAKAVGGGVSHRAGPAVPAPVQRIDVEGVVSAWQAGEFDVHFQPVIEVTTGRVVAVEALLRWQHPEVGLVPASAFADVVFGSSAGLDVGWWVLGRAQSALEALDPDIDLYVNVTANQLRDRARIRALCAAPSTGRRVVLELTEGALGSEGAAIRDTVIELRTAGYGVAIDDFGSGYSSFSRLRYFPTDVLKIDRSLVSSADRDPYAQRILRGILRLGMSLEAVVVAEGVQHPGELALLQALGVHRAQGNLLHPPMPAVDLLAAVAAQPAAPPPPVGRQGGGMP